jgi:hypothetical protein
MRRRENEPDYLDALREREPNWRTVARESLRLVPPPPARCKEIVEERLLPKCSVDLRDRAILRDTCGRRILNPL